MAQFTNAKADQILSFPVAKPLISFKIPDSWEMSDKDGTLFVTSPDGGEVIVEVMTLDALSEDDAASVKEAKSTFEQDFKNLKFTEADPVKNKGLTITMVGGEGEDESGEAHLNMLLIKHPEAAHQVLFSIVAAKEAAEKHGAACGAMLESIQSASAAKPMDKTTADADTQIYAYPNEATPSFTMNVPADWTLEADEKGAWIASADKKFTLNVIPIDIEHIREGMENITEQVSSKYDKVVWNEDKEPQTNIDEATGTTFISSEGVAKGGGYEHKLGVYQFAKRGAAKFFVLSAWSPLELATGPNGEAALKMLMSVKLD